MKRWLALAPVLILAALALLFATKSLRRDPHVEPMAMVGKPLPDIVLAPLGGGPGQPLRAIAATAGNGGPVLINLYASWCAPCADEAPDLDALKAQGVPIIGIAYKDTDAKAAVFLGRYGDPYAAKLSDPDGLGGMELGVTGPPETYAVNAAGVIVAKHVGQLSVADGQALLRKAAQP